MNEHSIRTIFMVFSIISGGFSDLSTKRRYVYVPKYDEEVFDGLRTETTATSSDECAVICLYTQYCEVFSISGTKCFLYSPSYVFLFAQTTNVNDAKTYRSTFDLTYQVCDGNFSVDSTGELCYMVMDGKNNKKSWNDALTSCLELDSLLVILDTQKKFDQYIQLIRGLDTTTKYWWTGGIDFVGKNKNWEWMNGRPVIDSHWLPNEPTSIREQCVELKSNELGFNDESCTSRRNFICEKILSI